MIGIGKCYPKRQHGMNDLLISTEVQEQFEISQCTIGRPESYWGPFTTFVVFWKEIWPSNEALIGYLVTTIQYPQGGLPSIGLVLPDELRYFYFSYLVIKCFVKKITSRNVGNTQESENSFLEI